MNCTRCNSDYTRMAGVQRFKLDYGYCSLACLIADKPPCLGCGAVLKPNAGECLAKFVQRSFCSQRCAAVYYGTQRGAVIDTWHRQGPVSDQTRQKLRNAWHDRPADKRQEMQAKRVAGQRQWRKTPEGIKATTDDYAQLMRERGHYQASSERMTAFYQTPEGEAYRQRLAAMKRGKPRPPLVRKKLRDALNVYWNTPEGITLRERLSELRSDGLHDAPYGPNWNNQRSKARKRDGRCILCERTADQNGKALDVHHIHARRKFGYVPGQNTNYQFANHLANLITLCPACHMRVEMKGATVPVGYQQQADALWALFTAA